MKILHIINSLDVGGSETSLLRLIHAADQSRFEFEVLSLTTVGEIGRRIEDLDVPVRALGLASMVQVPAKVLRLSDWLHQAQPDVIQTWLYHANFVGGIAARLARVRAPIIWGIRQANTDTASNKLLTLAVAKLGAWLSSPVPWRVVCNAEAVRLSHSKFGYPNDKMVVIPNGFDVNEFRPNAQARVELRSELGVGQDTKLVGLFGRFDVQKDHHTFIAAAKKISDRQSGVRFVLAGTAVDNSNQQLVSWVDSAGIRDACHLLGERHDMSILTAALDVAVSASLGEGLANVVGEAMACGVPCVVTDVGDSALLVGECGHVVPTRDADSLACAVEGLLALGSRPRNALSVAARKRITDWFSIEREVGQYARLYEDAVDVHAERHRRQASFRM